MNQVVCRTDKQNEQIWKINKEDTHDRQRVYNPHTRFNQTKESTTSTRSKQRMASIHEAHVVLINKPKYETVTEHGGSDGNMTDLYSERIQLHYWLRNRTP